MSAAPQHHFPNTEPPERLLTIAEVESRVGFKSSSIYLKIQQKKFPPPVKVGTASRWTESSIQKWILDYIQGGGWHA
ncbi:MAG: AlpA family phage regulatory protein [Nitrosomonas sp.]|nr:AlpA family phage regulatory protein [Nitrosomonas sp.]MCW5607782.1 AlpA family phage regulatory protein [Nitrosomonas sp.]